ncbi:MAG: HEAT repeat domain-containing protein [Phycisphaerae bacterium]|nr:HEAT repeat domain-containing protein [Phycisphaerae bacterium]
MFKRILAITIATLVAHTAVFASASDDAQYFYSLARDQWVPVQIQSQAGIDMKMTPEQANKRLGRACLYLEVAAEKDPSNPAIWRDLFTLYSSEAIDDPNAAREALVNYGKLQPDDNQLVRQYIADCLEQRKKADEKIEYLKETIEATQNYPEVQCEVYLMIGNSMKEMGMLKNSVDNDGKDVYGEVYYYKKAFDLNSFNPAVITALLMVYPEDINSPEFSAKDSYGQEIIVPQKEALEAFYYRLLLFNNPANPTAAMKLINTLVAYDQHEIALRYYNHAIGLAFSQLPEAVADLYLKYQISCYLEGMNLQDLIAEMSQKDNKDEIEVLKENSKTLAENSIEIADMLLKANPDDVIVLAIKAKVLAQLDKKDEEKKIKDKIDLFAQKSLLAEDKAKQSYIYQELTRYYCFAKPDPEKAMTFAEESCKIAPSAENYEFLAYAQMLKGLDKDALTMVKEKKLDEKSPVTALIIAENHWKNSNLQSGVDALAKVQTWGLLLEQRDQLMTKLQPENKENQSQALAAEMQLILAGSFDDQEFGMAFEPEKYIRCALSLKKTNLVFGQPIMAEIYISNLSRTTITLGQNCMVNPNILIVAHAEPVADPGQQGRKRDIDKYAIDVPVCYRGLGFSQFLGPRETIKIEECLSIGLLREAMMKYPQQRWEVTFHAYLDPIELEDGKYDGLIKQIQPKPVKLSRSGIAVSSQKMQYYYRSCQSDSPRERIDTAEVFVGLLKEQKLSQERKLNYRPYNIDSKKIKALLAKNLTDPEANVRARTSFALDNVPMDAQLVAKLAALLKDEDALVRFAALDTLSGVAELSAVLDSMATDESPVIARLVRLLQGQQLPEKLETSNSQDQEKIEN